MKPILLLGVLGCMLMDVAMSISTSKSCTMVNGEWKCEEMINKHGNYAGARSSSSSGPAGSTSTRHVESKSGKDKYSSFTKTEDHDNAPYEGSVGDVEDILNIGIPAMPSNDLGTGSGGAFSFAGAGMPFAGAGFPIAGAGFPFGAAGFPFGDFDFRKKRK